MFSFAVLHVRCDLHLFFLQFRKSIKHRQLSFRMPSTLYKVRLEKATGAKNGQGKRVTEDVLEV